MIIIRTKCENCGEVLVRSMDIQLHLHGDENPSFYQFDCPKCGKVGTGEADHNFIQILLANGVKPLESNIPDEFYEKKEGHPINWDDILDFHNSLRKPHFDQELFNMQK
jgi:predicted RNA-binding Zn-ribbon protein involved in translation (DUF1610 family)